MVLASFTLGIERYRYPQDLPKVAAKSGPSVQGPELPNVPPDVRPAVRGRRRRRQPWQYGNQGILLNSDGLKQALFGPIDGRRATARRSVCPDDAARGARSSSSPCSRVIMVLLTVFLFFTFGQYRTGPTNGYSAVFTDASRLATGDTVRVAGHPGRHGRTWSCTDDKVEVEFDADKIVLTTGTKVEVRYLNLVGDRYLELVDWPGIDQDPADGFADSAGSHRAGARPRPAARRAQTRDPGAQSAGRQRAQSALVQVFQGQGGTLDSLLSKTSSFSNDVGGQQPDVAATDRQPQHRGRHALQGRRPVLRRPRPPPELITGFSQDRDPIGTAIDSLDNGTASLADLLTQARPPLARTVDQLNRLAPTLDERQGLPRRSLAASCRATTANSPDRCLRRLVQLLHLRTLLSRHRPSGQDPSSPW